jgi:hypothetical protein
MRNRTLTARQRALVDVLVGTGVTITRAAQDVGMTREAASRALRKDHVAAYYRERMCQALMTGAPQALQRLLSLLDAGSEYVQLEASKQILDRSGFGKADQQVRLESKDVRVIIDLS